MCQTICVNFHCTVWNEHSLNSKEISPISINVENLKGGEIYKKKPFFQNKIPPLREINFLK